MNKGTELSLDMVLTLLRYAMITYFVGKGFDSDTQMAYINLAAGGVTVLWGLHATYWTRIVARFKAWTGKDI